MKIIILGLSVLVLVYSQAFSQTLSYERDRHKIMLRQISADVKKYYYDPSYKGINLEQNLKASEAKIANAESIGQMSGIIAQFLADFDDSHLFFLPPGKANKTNYGFEMRMVGDKCFVISIDEKSDAAKKGLAVGDQILGVDNYGPTRANLWKMRYFYYTLRPRQGLHLAIVKPDGKELEIDILARITGGKQVMDLTGSDFNDYIREIEDASDRELKQYFYDKLPGIFIWKMPSFVLEPSKVDEIVDKARKSDLIIDLRGNSGGRVDMLLRLIGNVFPADVKIGDEVGRKETKPVTAKTRKNAFSGKLVILVDSRSASASEVFSKVIQLEKRGTVLGDQTAGAVMESRYYGHEIGVNTIALYGASITIADLIMSDGKSLEKVGVMPDERILPNGVDLSNGRDIVMARAVEVLGGKITPDAAGRLFPKESRWR